MRKFYNVSTITQIPFFCSNHNKKILYNYKNFILNKINAEIKKNFFNPLVSFENNNKENDLKEKTNIYNLFNDISFSDNIEDEENEFKENEYIHNLYDDISPISLFENIENECENFDYITQNKHLNIELNDSNEANKDILYLCFDNLLDGSKFKENQKIYKNSLKKMIKTL